MRNRRSETTAPPIWPRLAGTAVLLLTAASCVPANRFASIERIAVAEAAAIPKVEPTALRPIAPEAAIQANAAIPVADLDNPAARAFSLRTRTGIDRLRSLDCLTSAIYYEAASETDDGQRAVAQVVLNRVRHPSYPNSVCGVVYQGSERTTGCQFTFTCDGSLGRTPSIASWARARRIAAEALAGRVFAPVGHATHYHTHQVLPYWASSLVKSAVIGAHIFYRWSGHWGRPTAFRQAYAGVEPLPGPKVRPVLALPPPNVALLRAELAAITAPAPQAAFAIPGSPPKLTVDEPLSAQDRLPRVVTSDRLPKSEVREAYRYSGMPLDQVPAAKAADAAR